MKKTIQRYLAEVKIGGKQTYKNLVLFPLLSPYVAGVDYLTLDEALAGGLIEVAEVSDSGAVPELKVVNASEKMILILDGEELVGAKQNRIVNTTILVAAKSTTVIPVSCVEEGRWSYDTPKFYSRERMMSANLRAIKARQVHDAVRYSGRYRSDQGAIWEEISAKAERMEAESPSMAMGQIFEKKERSIGDYTTHFRLVDMQVGAVFAINGKVVGMDCFGKSDTFTGVFEKLVKSYVLDAIDWCDDKNEDKVLKGDITKFLKASQNGDVESRPSVGLGTDIRIESDRLTGFALALGNDILHLSVFVDQDGGKRNIFRSEMQRFSNRRRFRS